MLDISHINIRKNILKDLRPGDALCMRKINSEVDSVTFNHSEGIAL